MAPSEHDDVKELTRKLYWAVSSTLRLTKRQKTTTFTWAADMAERICLRSHPSLPPSVDSDGLNGYHGQAEGRGGGRIRSSIQRSATRKPPLPDQAGWERRQQALRDRAWAYVLGEPTASSSPIAAGVDREVGNGRSNSTG